jgi:hypothetical protein
MFPSIDCVCVTRSRANCGIFTRLLSNDTDDIN